MLDYWLRYFTLTKMATIKTENNNCWQECGDITALWVGMEDGAAPPESVMAVPQKVKHRITI